LAHLPAPFLIREELESKPEGSSSLFALVVSVVRSMLITCLDSGIRIRILQRNRDGYRSVQTPDLIGEERTRRFPSWGINTETVRNLVNQMQRIFTLGRPASGGPSRLGDPGNRRCSRLSLNSLVCHLELHDGTSSCNRVNRGRVGRRFDLQNPSDSSDSSAALCSEAFFQSLG
jgi:hypothetical protein